MTPNDEIDQLLRDLIAAFVVREECREALDDPAARGVRECITHLQNYRELRNAGE